MLLNKCKVALGVPRQTLVDSGTVPHIFFFIPWPALLGIQDLEHDGKSPLQRERGCVKKNMSNKLDVKQLVD